MRTQTPKIYKSHRFFRAAVKVSFIALLICALLFVALFFGLRRYAVYTPEGVRLDIPILRDND